MILFSKVAIADTVCFTVSEGKSIIEQRGDCERRHSPASTFKIALALMGFNEGILKDATNPEWPFKDSYVAFLDNWKQPHNPTTWMRDSVIWYSQVLTPKIGAKKFQDYLNKFEYGNKDASGDIGQNNGLTNSWLSSSLKISPHEQSTFLQKFLDKELSLSANSYEMTKKILFRENLADGWELYGKTGLAYFQNSDGTKDTNRQTGWFVGWITKNNRNITFVHYIEDAHTEEGEIFASYRARDAAKEKLVKLIEGGKI